MSTTDNTGAPTPPAGEDRIIYRDELRRRLSPKVDKPLSSETVRVWIRDRRIPEPDVSITLKTKGWKASTLRAAGLPF